MTSFDVRPGGVQTAVRPRICSTKLIISSQRNAHFHFSTCQTNGQSADLLSKTDRFVEAKRSLSLFDLCNLSIMHTSVFQKLANRTDHSTIFASCSSLTKLICSHDGFSKPQHSLLQQHPVQLSSGSKLAIPRERAALFRWTTPRLARPDAQLAKTTVFSL